MRKALFFLSFGWALLVSAQPVSRPSWVVNRPQVGIEKLYYYRVTIGEGITYDKAYANAFAKAILESSWKLGVEVNAGSDLKTIEDDITANISVEKSRMNLPMNKVCEFVEPLTGKRGVRIYVLWQVAKYGNVPPNFDEFTNCE